MFSNSYDILFSSISIIIFLIYRDVLISDGWYFLNRRYQQISTSQEKTFESLTENFSLNAKFRQQKTLFSQQGKLILANVCSLLLQKEHDLELAARIGQALLQENVLLKSQNDELNTFCEQLNDRVKQLKHENDQKGEMLNMIFQEEAANEGIDLEGAANSSNVEGSSFLDLSW